MLSDSFTFFTLIQGFVRVLSLPSHTWTCALLFERPCLFLFPAQFHLPSLPVSHHDGQGLHELEHFMPLRQREFRHPRRLHARHTEEV